ncbi:MAG TPA: hypothetical protein PKE01_02960 [Rhodocyclaceae bacterium]|nr:hypothetical protein [Rhodocyclaceae bacterium]HMW50740.1 hypothetical protein [Rhodocyclaceae bacterium]HMZ76002.1 hypothetical protein [Rhodocyclaceae bacterium]HNI82884.1 hypothetical protein [Rhodocyclaceae bacterium]
MLTQPIRSKQAVAAEREWAGQARRSSTPDQHAAPPTPSAGRGKLWLLLLAAALIAPKLLHYF